jgi:hypothetical protein
MDLKEFTSGTPSTKPWLTIVAKSITADTITANNVVSPPTTAFASMVAFNTLAGAQTAANLLVGLSPNSRLTIPANSMVVGDAYRLEFNAVMDNPAPGDSCTFDFASTTGAITSFPIIAPSPFAGTPVIAVCNFTLASQTTINVQTTIAGFVIAGGPPTASGFSFGQAAVPFDSSIDQDLTFSYTTANFTNAEITRLVLFRMASGAQ